MSLHDVGVSGEATNQNWMVYRNAVLDAMAALGLFHAAGLDAWARINLDKIRLRYRLGMRAEDVAAEFAETWPKPNKQDNGIAAIRAAVCKAKQSGHWNVRP
jgi:hypothetical protein